MKSNKKFLNKGLKTTFYINVEFKKWFRRFGTLALVPLNYLEEAWNIILDSKPKISNCDDYDKSIINFLEYFVNNWLIGKDICLIYFLICVILSIFYRNW